MDDRHRASVSSKTLRVLVPFSTMLLLGALGWNLAFSTKPTRVEGVLLAVLFWPAMVLGRMVPSNNIGTAERPVFEATPVNAIAGLLGMLLGILFWGFMAYLAVRWIEGRRAGASG